MISGWLPQAHRAALFALCALLLLTPFSKAAVEISFFLLLLPWLVAFVRPWHAEHPCQTTPLAQPLYLFLLFYVAVCTWSVVSSDFPYHSLRGVTRKTFEYALLFIMAADVASRPGTAKKGIRYLLIGAWGVALYALFQEMMIHNPFNQVQVLDPIRDRPLDYAKMVGPYENPNDLATYLMVTALIALPLANLLQGAKRIAQWILIVLLVGSLVWTQSMGAYLGFGVGALLLLFAYRDRPKLLVGLGAGLLISAVGLLWLSKRDLSDIFALADIASQDRRVMWGTAWAMILDRPILGHGTNTFMANYLEFATGPNQGPAYAHNCFLQIAAETGLVGLSAFLLFLGAYVALGWRMLKAAASKMREPFHALRVGLFLGTLAFIVQSFFDTNLYALRQAVLFWTLAGMTLGLAMQGDKATQND